MSEKGCLEIRLKPCMEVIENLIHFLNIYCKGRNGSHYVEVHDC